MSSATYGSCRSGPRQRGQPFPERIVEQFRGPRLKHRCNVRVEVYGSADRRVTEALLHYRRMYVRPEHPRRVSVSQAVERRSDPDGAAGPPKRSDWYCDQGHGAKVATAPATSGTDG